MLRSDVLEALVFEVNHAVRRRGLEMARDVGRLLLDRLFEGSPAVFRAPAGEQRASFRQLASHPSLEISASALHAYVAVSIQLSELPPAVAAELALTKHRYLLPLRDPRVKAELARRCVDEEWSAERLRREVSALRPPGSRPGRPRTPVLVRIVDEVERALVDERLQALDFDLPDTAQLTDLLERLSRAEQAIHALRSRLAQGERSGTPSTGANTE